MLLLIIIIIIVISILASSDGQDTTANAVKAKKAKVDTKGTLDNAASDPLNLKSVIWEREADKSTWTKYSADQVTIINEAFKTGKTDVDLTDGKSEVTVIFERMVQRNKKSGWEKRIRCVSADGSSDPDERKSNTVKFKHYCLNGIILPVTAKYFMVFVFPF